jgi:hypothetical protein
MIMAFLQTTTLARVQQAVGLADVNLQITDSSVAKLSRKYFARGFLPPSCLQASMATRIAPMETIATIRCAALRFACGHNSQRASNTDCSISTKIASFRARSASVDLNKPSTMIDSFVSWREVSCRRQFRTAGLFEECWPKSLDHTAPKGGHQYLVFRLVVVEKRTPRDTRRGSDGLQGRSLITLYDKEL